MRIGGIGGPGRTQLVPKSTQIGHSIAHFYAYEEWGKQWSSILFGTNFFCSLVERKMVGEGTGILSSGSLQEQWQ